MEEQLNPLLRRTRTRRKSLWMRVGKRIYELKELKELKDDEWFL